MTDWTQVPEKYYPKKSAREIGSGHGDTDDILSNVERQIESETEAQEENYQRGFDDGERDSYANTNDDDAYEAGHNDALNDESSRDSEPEEEYYD